MSDQSLIRAAWVESASGQGMVGVFGLYEPKPGRTVEAASLHDWCRERLANYKTPKHFEIRAELPRLPIGKIDKQALKLELAEQRG